MVTREINKKENIKMYSNVAVIMQPHYMTNCFRVSTNLQVNGGEFNYIIVTCSPTWNGMYRYPAKNTSNYKIWTNKKRPCYCVPVGDCTKFKELNEIQDETLLKEIREQQEYWKNKKKTPKNPAN